MRKEFRVGVLFLVLFYLLVGPFFPAVLYSLILIGPILIIGLIDYSQKRHSVRRNFPIIGNFRYLFEAIRPEINQYFVESNSDGAPFSREQRSLVYQRAKGDLDTLPFGTQRNVYDVGYEWVSHSIMPVEGKDVETRVWVGGPDCKQPYHASIFNISAMSYGALSQNAVEALNLGAKLGGFYHNTGEGSASPYHQKHGGDLVWQIGTGYFGCRTPDGRFSAEKFQETATKPQVKMIEIKLSQGAKPGHGGILPKAKLTLEIAKMRLVEMGKDVVSPPGHSAFATPIELLQFVKQLRDLSGGKPVGFKLCLGKQREFIAICKAMLETGITPDFVTLDGGEGGTGAAPLEFSNSVGAPLREALVFVHNSLVGFGVREKIKIIASGKVTTGIDLVSKLALGADMCNSARGMMLALGCIQALRCNSNSCPVGITTNNPELVSGLDVEIKSKRVQSFHHQTVKSAVELVGAMGFRSTTELRPWHISRRTGPDEIKHYGEIFNYLEKNDLIEGRIPPEFERAVRMASAKSFAPVLS